ncbi:hypothetical protein A2V71_03615 [Candidatus Berkelbacteria bacterium RBG_13_40_8]|uniref:ATP-grasp domain-containing protein n=1 Tax=Candidatus Berkelbacteria bacterium RBG_13_40_8 TaxID=1797467 RepID=A0A1F5DNG5_9BACT|nr:MAG: hypothetical protein A2V71_03615 [Candidatus Berkelbacteria bacterium RBG_13_40_8]
MSKKPIRVLITGAGGGSVGSQILDALKMAKTPYYIVSTNTNPNKTGLYSVDKGYLLPKAEDPQYIFELLKICKYEKIQVIIPGSEQELGVIGLNVAKFKENKILPLINTPEVIEICQNKLKTMEALKANGLLYPKYAILGKKTLPKGFSFPVVIKPSKGGGGSRNVFIIQDQNDLEFYGTYYKKKGLIPLIQEYIGTPNHEYTVGVLSDLEGKILGSIALRREISGNLSTLLQIENKKDKNNPLTLSTGVSQGFVDDYNDVRKYCEKIAFVLGSRGPLNIQCRKTPKGIYTMEINPRFSGTSSIRALLGFNEPDTLIRKHLLGEKVSEMRYKKGLVLREFRMEYIKFSQISQLKKQGYIGNSYG